MEIDTALVHEHVEQRLGKILESRVSLLQEAGEQIVLAGGKRIRPRLVLLAYGAAGGLAPEQVVPLATAVELIHTASLIHDDVNDHSDTRRGRQTVNGRWGNTVALLAGDFVFTKMLQIAAGLPPRIVQVLAEACVNVVEGEARQVLSQWDTGMSEETYLQIVDQKTASLFAACAESGGILAGAQEEWVAALHEYGLNLGIAFQIRDDTLDLEGESDRLGKPAGNDLVEGKMSVAILYALSRSQELRAMLLCGDVERALCCLGQTGAIEYARQKAMGYAEKARDALAFLSDSPSRAALWDLVDFVIARTA